MKVKIHTTEQIVAKLREVERLQATGQSIAEACKQIAVVVIRLVQRSLHGQRQDASITRSPCFAVRDIA